MLSSVVLEEGLVIDEVENGFHLIKNNEAIFDGGRYYIDDEKSYCVMLSADLSSYLLWNNTEGLKSYDNAETFLCDVLKSITGIFDNAKSLNMILDIVRLMEIEDLI